MRKHEEAMKREYNKRVIQIEQGTFTPLIFTTTGVMGHECSIYHKNLAEKISEKRKKVAKRYKDTTELYTTLITPTKQWGPNQYQVP